MASFIQGCLIVMRGEEGASTDKMAIQLEELMSDSDLYGWEKHQSTPRGLAESAGTRLAHMGGHGGKALILQGAHLAPGHLDLHININVCMPERPHNRHSPACAGSQVSTAHHPLSLHRQSF